MGFAQTIKKIDALNPCLDNCTFLQTRPLLDGERTFNDIKVFKPLDQHLHELLNAPRLGEVKPSEFLNKARRAIKVEDMTLRNIYGLITARSSDILVDCFWMSNR